MDEAPESPKADKKDANGNLHDGDTGQFKPQGKSDSKEPKENKTSKSSNETNEPVKSETIKKTEEHKEFVYLNEIVQNKNNGKIRFERYGDNWQSYRLSDALEKFVPKAQQSIVNNKGKIIYSNGSPIEIVYDVNGKYFRIADNRIKGRRKYLDINGNDVSNKILDNGKCVGRDKDEYLQITHFKDIE